MLTDNAKAIGWGLRQYVGADKKGIGPDIRQLMELFPDVEPSALRSAIDELEGEGFVRANLAIGTPIDGIPPDFRGVVGVSVTEAMQLYFDDLGL